MNTEQCILCGSTVTSKNWFDRKWQQRYRCHKCWRTFFSGQTYYSGSTFAEQLYNAHFVYGIDKELLAVYHNVTVRKINSIIRWELKRREAANQPYHLSPVKMFDPANWKEFLPTYLERYGKEPLRMPDGRAIHAASLPNYGKGFDVDPTALYKQPPFNNQTIGCPKDPQIPYQMEMLKGNEHPLPPYTP